MKFEFLNYFNFTSLVPSAHSNFDNFPIILQIQQYDKRFF